MVFLGVVPIGVGGFGNSSCAADRRGRHGVPRINMGAISSSSSAA